jgi:hypothetical protein
MSSDSSSGGGLGSALGLVRMLTVQPVAINAASKAVSMLVFGAFMVLSILRLAKSRGYLRQLL